MNTQQQQLFTSRDLRDKKYINDLFSAGIINSRKREYFLRKIESRKYFSYKYTQYLKANSLNDKNKVVSKSVDVKPKINNFKQPQQNTNTSYSRNTKEVLNNKGNSSTIGQLSETDIYDIKEEINILESKVIDLSNKDEIIKKEGQLNLGEDSIDEEEREQEQEEEFDEEESKDEEPEEETSREIELEESTLEEKENEPEETEDDDFNKEEEEHEDSEEEKTSEVAEEGQSGEEEGGEVQEDSSDEEQELKKEKTLNQERDMIFNLDNLTDDNDLINSILKNTD